VRALRVSWARWLPFLAVATTLACSGKSSTDEDSGAGGGTASSGGTGAPGGASSGAGGAPSPFPCEGDCADDGVRPTPLPRPDCPEKEPALGGACDEAGLQCSYGDSPTPRCRHYYVCDAATWTADERPSNFTCETAPNCPSAPTTGSACVLEVPGEPCPNGNLWCFCEAGIDAQIGDTGTWACFGPPMNPACPASLPNLGEGCEEQAVECKYAVNGCTAAPYSTVFCRNGVWEEGEELLCFGK
jgi:hypothetical protein